jgi:hypothetical protein
VNNQHYLVLAPGVTPEGAVPEFLKDSENREAVDRIFGDWEELVAAVKKNNLSGVNALFDTAGRLTAKFDTIGGRHVNFSVFEDFCLSVFGRGRYGRPFAIGRQTE